MWRGLETRTKYCGEKILNLIFCGVFSDTLLASWIDKTSSLPFLNRFNAGDNRYRHDLLSTDVNTPPECNGHLELQQLNESETVPNVKDKSYRLTSSEKISLILKRLIPLAISLAMLGGAVAIRYLIPLPSSREMTAVGNDTLNLNSTYNFTTKSPMN